MPSFGYRHIVLMATVSLVSSSCLLSQNGYFSIKYDTIVLTRDAKMPVALRKGEIFESLGPLGFWRKDTFWLREESFVPLDAKKKIEVEAKTKNLARQKTKLIRDAGKDSVRISLKALLLEKGDTSYLIADGKDTSFLMLMGKKDTTVTGKILPAKFRLSAPGWPAFFFERDSVFKATPKPSDASWRDSLIRLRDSALYVQNYKDQHETIVLWPLESAEFLIIVGLISLLLIVFLAGWKVMPKFVKPEKMNEKTIAELREQNSTLESDSRHFRTQLSIASANAQNKNTEITNLSTQIQALTRQLEELRLQVPFRLAGYGSFLETDGSIDVKLDKQISLVEEYFETRSLHNADSWETHALSAVLQKYRANLKSHREAQERWNTALRTMADGDGAIVEKEILKTLNNVEGPDAKLEELRGMYFVQWMQHKVSAVFILLEEVRSLSSLTDQPSEELSKLSESMRAIIDDLLAAVKQGLGCNVVYVPLFSPVKEEVGNVEATRTEKAKSWYLNHRLDEKERETILEIERYATDSSYMTKDKDKQTSVLVKIN